MNSNVSVVDCTLPKSVKEGEAASDVDEDEDPKAPNAETVVVVALAAVPIKLGADVEKGVVNVLVAPPNIDAVDELATLPSKENPPLSMGGAVMIAEEAFAAVKENPPLGAAAAATGPSLETKLEKASSEMEDAAIVEDRAKAEMSCDETEPREKHHYQCQHQ